MASPPSSKHSVERRRSHSTPQAQTMKSATPSCKRDDHTSSVESTYSLLSPIYHDSYESYEEDRISNSGSITDLIKSRKPSVEDEQKCNNTQERHLEELNLTPWEEWLLYKEKKERAELQRKMSEELKQEEERIKREQLKEMKKVVAEEQHKEWVRKKAEQERKEKEFRLLKEQKEKEAKELQNMAMQEKSKEKYQEWLRRKKEEAQERARKEKEEEEKRLAEQSEKQEKAKKGFEEWLEQVKVKPRPTLNSDGYVNGKLTGYYDGSSYPAPGFYNPIPWKPIHVPPPPKEAAKNLSEKKKKRATSSQPYRANVGSLYKPKDNLHVGGGMFRR
ncbi:coiled-coil domain-containing protein 34 [Bombina bombina]|uniref:coiled-coil domain-containing protein 34 n=1 Tax=Bombina bombina TaxID=8345 RepID=UPI00235A75BE|nr:coiled-coil domain-containing protein 34 [Bombina bombina]